jgi:hypothetical protein
MASGFEIDPDWESKLRRHLQPMMQKIADDHQLKMDDLFGRYKGRSVAEVKPAVAREMATWGGSMSDTELTRVATAISNGQRVVLRGGN